jgi:hypothetical protein
MTFPRVIFYDDTRGQIIFETRGHQIIVPPVGSSVRCPRGETYEVKRLEFTYVEWSNFMLSQVTVTIRNRKKR